MTKKLYILGGIIAILLAGWYVLVFSRIDNGDQKNLGYAPQAEVVMGGDIQFKDVPINEKWSYESVPNSNFKNLDPKEFNNTKIIGTNFSKDNEPFSDIFPEGMTGVVFIGCNLDNVYVPAGNYIYNFEGMNTNKQIKEQNDGEFWLVDKDLKPIEPFNKEQFEELGISTDPKDIPPIKMNMPITQFKAEEKMEGETK